MPPADVMPRRLAAQQLSSNEPAEPADVVARLGAVQAQDYLGALWAVGQRADAAREADVERALAEGSVVRTWPMRGTLHFVAAADARWMVQLLGPRVVSRAEGRLRSFGLDAATLGRARRALVRALEGGRALTRTGVYEVLERAKIAAAEQRGLHVLWRLAHDCVVCFGPRRGKQQTFVLFDEWVRAGRPMPREEALAALAHRYFTGHGPASAADFAWWSGLAPAEARRALEMVKPRLDEVRVDGEAMWIPRGAAALRPARASAFLLPAFDELLVGYKDRSAALAPSHLRRADAGGGIFYPVLLVDRRVAGTWKRELSGRRVSFSPAWFGEPSAAQLRAVTRAFRRYAAFLGREPA